MCVGSASIHAFRRSNVIYASFKSCAAVPQPASSDYHEYRIAFHPSEHIFGVFKTTGGSVGSLVSALEHPSCHHNIVCVKCAQCCCGATNLNPVVRTELHGSTKVIMFKTFKADNNYLSESRYSFVSSLPVWSTVKNIGGLLLHMCSYGVFLLKVFDTIIFNCSPRKCQIWN